MLRPAALTAALLMLHVGRAARADDACRAVLQQRIQQCAEDCIERARAAVDPDVRGRILGYGCATNCAKLEMFNGHTGPEPGK